MKRRLFSILMAATLCLALCVSAGAYQITIRTMTKSFPLEVELSDTVLAIKTKVQEKEGIPPDQQQLSFSGRILEENQTLADYNIQQDDEIQLALRSIGTEGTTELSDIHEALNATGDASIKLLNDIDYSDVMTVQNNLTLDLNGHVLNLSSSGESRITVEGNGSLTIIDSNPTAEHRFTPGVNGLWGLDENNGTKTVKGGVITGGHATNGGGVYVAAGGRLTMTGGNIVGCSAAEVGGGVCIDGLRGTTVDQTAFTMTGGSITGCLAAGTDGGGGVNVTGGTFTMSGGSITECTAHDSDLSISTSTGGGVHIRNGGSFTMSGGTIQNCKSSGDRAYGGGVYVGTGQFTMNGGSIAGCRAEGTSVSEKFAWGGGVYNNGGSFTMNDGTIASDCTADGSGGGVYNEKTLYANGGEIAGDVVNGIPGQTTGTITGSGGTKFSGKVTNNKDDSGNKSVIECGTFNGPVTNYGSITGGTFNGTVTNKGAITGGMFNDSVVAEASDEDTFLEALADKNVTTIKLKDSITVKATDTVNELTIDRAITLVNGDRDPVLTLKRPLTIAEGGSLTLEGNVYLYPCDSMEVNGGVTVGAGCGVSFEVEESSLTIHEGGTVTTVRTTDAEIASSGLLSLGQDAALTVEGTLVNNGRLSVSNMANLKKAAGIGGELTLYSMTITENYTLDMQGNLLTISDFLRFENNANLTVKNASKVEATDVTISGGSYYCPVTVGDNEGRITGGSFYGPVTVREQGGGQSAPISGGTFYDGLNGSYLIQGHKVTFMNGDSKYAMQVVADGGKASAPDAPSKDGYRLTGWYTDDGKKFNFEEDTVTENITLTARWTLDRYTISYDLNGGTANGNPDSYTVESKEITLNAPARPGYTFIGWSGTGLTGESNLTVTIEKGSTGDRSYTAHWSYNGGSSGGSSSPSYAITVPGKTENGTVTVNPKNASKGTTVTITVKPDSGYVLETISATDKNGNSLKLTDKGSGKYTFTMPGSKVEVKATFMEDNSVLNFFYDVPNDAYYYEAVKWAVENGITGGVGNNLFAPNQPCTRAQIVTFLWRAAGSPVVNYLIPFDDVDEGAYYAEAVRWAASTGIVTGLTETTFGANNACTRAQAAAMIYRYAQVQGKGFTGAWMFLLPFTDVPEWAYESVAWCYMNGVTTGVSETAFAPGSDCTRAQIVTFLWRAFSK